MAKTIVALYHDLETARDVIRDLVDDGFQRDNISMMAGDTEETYREHDFVTDYDVEDYDPTRTRREPEDSAAAEGAGIGAVVGGLAGLVAGLGAITIPGVGPIIAAGPIISTLVGAGIGAAAGGILGALVDMGVPEEEAEYYAEGVRRGNVLVALRASDERADRAVNIMERHGPIDVEHLVSRWEDEGWTGYDPDAGRYTRQDVDRESYRGTERGMRTEEPSDARTRVRYYGSEDR